MDIVLSAINDLMIIIFDLILYMKILSLRWKTPRAKTVLFFLCGLIVAFYAIAVYGFGLPPSAASLFFMTIPSFVLFYIFSSYRDSRFVMTFCLVDTISLIIAFFGRYIAVLAGNSASILSSTIIFLLFMALFYWGHNFFEIYHKLLNTAKMGWHSMALSTILIYFAMIFIALYPKPLAQRMEYAPVWLVFALVVLSCYSVFIQSILKTKQIHEQNKQLEYEKNIFHLAYTDALTGLKNRASYIEMLNSLERQRPVLHSLCCIVMDLNKFKDINDTFGHSIGDTALKSTAICLLESFSDLKASIFRVGGDEFYLLLEDVTPEQVEKHFTIFDNRLLAMGNELSLYLTAAKGYAFVPDSLSVTIEDVFNEADKIMYEQKRSIHKAL